MRDDFQNCTVFGEERVKRFAIYAEQECCKDSKRCCKRNEVQPILPCHKKFDIIEADSILLKLSRRQMKRLGTLLCTLILAQVVANAEDLNKAKLKTQLVQHEGKRLKVYKDSEGVPTIGVGFNLKRKDAKSKIEALGLSYKDVLEGKVLLTDAQAETLLTGDIETAISDCESVVEGYSELSDVRKRVVVDMTFNLGKTRFSKFKKMLAALKAKDFIKAAAEMKDSKWCKQVKTRCSTLEQMMQANKDPLWLKDAD